MTPADRERQHQQQLARILNVQVTVGHGDHSRIDHEATLLERARLTGEEIRAHQATERGLAAMDRLLRLAEEGRGRQAADLTAFIAALRDNRPLPLATLRGLEAAVGDDMLDVLDAFRHARLNLVESVPGGARRVARLLDRKPVASD